MSDAASSWLFKRVRVYSGIDSERQQPPMAEGIVVGYQDDPTLVLRHYDGTQSQWSVRLPIEVLGEARVADVPQYLKNRTEQRTEYRLEHRFGPDQAWAPGVWQIHDLEEAREQLRAARRYYEDYPHSTIEFRLMSRTVSDPREVTE